MLKYVWDFDDHVSRMFVWLFDGCTLSLPILMAHDEWPMAKQIQLCPDIWILHFLILIPDSDLDFRLNMLSRKMYVLKLLMVWC